VNWTNPSEVNFSNVIVYYREAGDLYASWTSGPQSPDSTSTSLDLTGLSNDTAYQIRISSVSTGGREGNEIIIDGNYTPQAGLGGESEPSILEAPTDLSLEDNTANVRLEWTDNSNDETGFVIEKRLQGNSIWTTVATIGQNAQAFVENINIGSNSWEYRVKAVRDSESSDFTAVVLISRSGSGGTTPTAPSNLQANDLGSNVQLSWDDLSHNETDFVIERRLQGTPSWINLATRPANSNQFSDFTAIGGDSYEYRVKAINGGAHSTYSNVVLIAFSGGGTTPSIPDSVHLKTFSIVGTITTISIDTLSGRIYRLYVSNDLENWTAFGTRIGSGSTQNFVFDKTSPSAMTHFSESELNKCFFKIELEL
tara:strand:- start:2515 stop:3618 length:1104 start_codon:yes stop_codon:yes gene_type:complete